jgi:AcrR family transcriptional regulator
LDYRKASTRFLGAKNKGLTNKQKAIKDREGELIQLAKGIVKSEGLTSLTMDRLAGLSLYSKGTIYNHFCSKEDVIIALCVDGVKQEIRMMSRAAGFQGSTRERMVALHVAYRTFLLLEPELTACVLVANTPWIIEKASAERVTMFRQLEEQVLGIASKIVNEAIVSGDMILSPEFTVDSVVFSNWSIAFGVSALAEGIHLEHSGASLILLKNINTLLDGLQWFPLSAAHDYKKVWRQVEQQIFSHEIKLIS